MSAARITALTKREGDLLRVGKKIAKALLEQDPSRSNNSIAMEVGISHHTVEGVRQETPSDEGANWQSANKNWQYSVSADVYDPEPKPPEAHDEVADGAGGSSEAREFPRIAFEVLQKWLGPSGGPDAVLLHPGHGKKALVLLRFEIFARTHTIRGDA
jgi:hypothetical protein